MRVLMMAAALALSGCATQAMNRYIGQPVQAAMARNGPPTNAFDMPDGTRAFQWARSGEVRTPTYATTTGSAVPMGQSVWWTQNTTITGGQALQLRCLYTVYARWNDASRAWIIERYEPIPYQCE